MQSWRIDEGAGQPPRSEIEGWERCILQKLIDLTSSYYAIFPIALD